VLKQNETTTKPPETGSESLLLTKQETADELRISRRQVDYLIAGNKLTKVKIGRSSRITRASVRDLAGQPITEAAE
jgi:excisionase family DNA binding protein